MSPLRIFISSVQKELAPERAALRDYLRGDALMRKFFKVFLFEELPATDRRADESYLAAGFIEMTQPSSPRSPTQKYRLTEKGRAWLKKTA